MDNIDALRGLSDKDVAIYNGEMAKRRKSTFAAYLLFFLTGGLGGHKWYLGRWGGAMGYMFLTFAMWVSFLGGVMMAGVFFGAVSAICGIVDVFTIPGQIRQGEDKYGKVLLDRLNMQQ